MDVSRTRQEYGGALIVGGNFDARVLCGSGLSAVRADVDLAFEQGSPSGRTMIAACNMLLRAWIHAR